MSEASPLPRLDAKARRGVVAARAAAFFVDTLIVAYGAWCVDRLAGTALLTARPWLLLLAPLVAALWETSGGSLGQAAYRVAILDGDGRPADGSRRAFRGVLVALEAAVVLAPVALAVETWRTGGGGSLLLVASVVLLLAGAATGLFDRAGRGLPDHLAGTHTGARSKDALTRVRPWWQRPNVWVVLGILGLTFAVGVTLTDFRPVRLVTGIERTEHLWAKILSPDWSITAQVIAKMVETVFLALMASVLALPFAFVLSFLGARNLMTKSRVGWAVYVVVRLFMNVTRSIEPLVWATIFILWVGMGAFAGVMALFVHSVAALAKLYSEAIESIDTGPVEAIQATGANSLQVLRYGVVPQVIPPFLSFTVYRWDINVRMATVVGLVGGGGIGWLLIEHQQMGAWSKVGTIMLFIALVVWAMDWASAKAREKLM